MRPAPAFEPRKTVADLLLRGVRGVAQQRRRSHDPAVEAIAALRHLLGDESCLQRMRLVRRAEPGEGRKLGPGRRRYRQRAGPRRRTVDMDGARPALREPTAEMRIVEAELIAQHVEERRI